MTSRRSLSFSLAAVGLSLGAQLLASTASAQESLPPPPAYTDPNMAQPGAQPGQPYYQPPPAQPYGQPQPYAQPPAQPYGQPQPAQPYGQPPSTTTYMQPQPAYGQPTYVQPQYAQPTYVQPPQQQYVTYAPRRFTYTPRFRPQFGLALRASGLWSENAAIGFGQGGIGVEALFRVHPRLTLELSVQYQSISNDYYYDEYGYAYQSPTAYYYDRRDVPILGGLRVHLGNPLWLLSPYVVGAAGPSWARLYTPDATESAWFFEAQGGIGVELRGGRHFTLNMDLRGMGRFRSLKEDSLYFVDGYGRGVPAMGNQGGVIFNFGIGGYF